LAHADRVPSTSLSTPLLLRLRNDIGFLKTIAAHSQAVDAEGWRSDSAAEFEVAGDFGNVQNMSFNFRLQ
jgi:hypothetical protein